MPKYTYFKSYLAKATPLQREVATKHFNSLWQSYQAKTEFARLLYQSRQLTLCAFRQVVKRDFRVLRQELKARLRLI